VEPSPGADYRRYEVTADGISAMTLPGTPDGMYTADGLEHGPEGTPSSKAQDHDAQLAKRLGKLQGFDFGPHWGEVRGTGPNCLLTWGSTAGAVFEAAERLSARGTPTRAIALRLLAPLPRRDLVQALDGTTAILVVEQNQAGQLFRYLRGEQALPPWARSLARPGPLPFRPGEIVQACLEDM
jgi:2-oxoglutarate ferredoxin oxidoreductase subunit alpha